MANAIYKNNAVILHCSNGLIEALYENLLFIAQQQNITSDPLLNFIESLNQEDYGRGCVGGDIENFFDNKQDLIVLAELVGLAIDKAVEERLWNSLIEQRVRDFQKKLVE